MRISEDSVFLWNMYEHRTHPVLSRGAFVKRVGWHVTLVIPVVIVGLGIGVCGYHYLAKLGWVDSLLNASMILSGMGPVDPLRDPGVKVFASFYALFSGIVFIAVASMLVAPFAHRVLHKIHFEEK
jgi:flagellar biosynthesis protein FliR